MKNNRIHFSSIVILVLILLSGCDVNESVNLDNNVSKEVDLKEDKSKQTVNLFVTHGHCSTTFTGTVDNLEVYAPLRIDRGNPLENLKLSFEIDPNSFIACSGDEVTERVRTQGLFVNKKNEKITFHSSEIYTMGLDWYQINGKMSIKGIENDVKLFATGIRQPSNSHSDLLILESKLDLLDWGIDYDKILRGESDPVPTKWMHLNMKIEL